MEIPVEAFVALLGGLVTLTGVATKMVADRQHARSSEAPPKPDHTAAKVATEGRMATLEAKLDAIHGEVRGARADVRDLDGHVDSLGTRLSTHEVADAERFGRLDGQITAIAAATMGERR